MNKRLSSITGQQDMAKIKTMHQVADLLKQIAPFIIDHDDQAATFESLPVTIDDWKGIRSAKALLNDESNIDLIVELVQTDADIRTSLSSVADYVAKLSSKTTLLPPITNKDSVDVRIAVKVQIQSSPLSFARSNVILKELNTLNEFAEYLANELPSPQKIYPNIENLYKSLSDIATPVYPVDGFDSQKFGSLASWAADTIQIARAFLPVALAVEDPLDEMIALSFLSRACLDTGSSLGKSTMPYCPPKSLLELAQKVTQKTSGTLAVPVLSIGLGGNVYEMAKEVSSTLQALSRSKISIIFYGPFSQLQSVFHGGQGGENDPLNPVVRSFDGSGISLKDCIEFAVEDLTRTSGGGLSSSEKDSIRNSVEESLAEFMPAEQKRLLMASVSNEFQTRKSGKNNSTNSSRTFLNGLKNCSLTLGGLSEKARSSRSPMVQKQFQDVLTSPALLPLLKEDLLGQDQALENLVKRLQMEVLTRPAHQPIRYCSQGTPGTGKSESAVLLARILGIPYVNIDIASIPDVYTASAQLLGSGRGIVGSHQAGRLEQVSKHHSGALVEVSDLDHARPAVRSALADLFLQVLDVGEAQSSTGAMFSCANLIFAFTMNLPDGMDEAVRKTLGFVQAESNLSVVTKVENEIKTILSTAFLSRVGVPILFDPLSAETLSIIAERAVKSAILMAAENLKFPVIDVDVETGLGARLISSLSGNVTTYGARRILEHGRYLAARAVIDFCDSKPLHSNGRLRVHFNSDYQMVLSVNQQP